ncbi:MAG: hypothetical protein ACJAYQ_002568, partial [Bacteriovoracaceae bacterium]
MKQALNNHILLIMIALGSLVLHGCGASGVGSQGFVEEKTPRIRFSTASGPDKIFEPWGEVIIGFSDTRTFTITNYGDETASSITATISDSTGLAIPEYYFEGTPGVNNGVGTYPGNGGTCGSSIAAGASCTVEITFRPLVSGLKSENVVVSFTGGIHSYSGTVGLTGEGKRPANILIRKLYQLASPNNSPDMIVTPHEDFPGELLPLSSTTPIMPIKIDPVLSDPYFPGVTSGTHRQTIDYGQTANGGWKDYIYEIRNYGDKVAEQVQVFGLGAGTGFSIVNDADTTCDDLYAMPLTPPAAFSSGVINMNDMGEMESCSIKVRYNPALAQGDSTGNADTIGFSFYNGFRIVGDPSLPAGQRLLTPLFDEPNLYDLTGTGMNWAFLVINEATSPYDYGTYANGSTRGLNGFTLENYGAASAVNVNDIGLNTNFTLLGTGSCVGGTTPTVNASAVHGTPASCDLNIQFTPQTVGNPLTDSIQLDYEFDGAGSLISTLTGPATPPPYTNTAANNSTPLIMPNYPVHDVQGTAVTPANLAIAPSPLTWTHSTAAYGTDLLNNGTYYQSFTVTNSGEYQALTFTDTAAIAAPFIYAGGFPGDGDGRDAGGTGTNSSPIDAIVDADGSCAALG